MRTASLLLSLLALLSAGPLAADSDPPREFPRGELIDGVAARSAPDQTYTLYLPSAYTPEKRWPIVFVFDPRGRARMAAELFVPGAERFGFILMSSGNTRSDVEPGEADPNTPALQTLLKDALERLAFDPRRVYFAGFSGTARFAWRVGAVLEPPIAGVVGCGGGLPGPFAEWKEVPFVYFGTAGFWDFNHHEMRQLDEDLDGSGIIHRFEFFEGGHGWAPTEILTEALGWMVIQAIRAGTWEASPVLVAELWAEGLAAARRREAEGELHAAWRRYRDLARDFAGLGDVAVATAAAARLAALPAAAREAAAIRAAVAAETAYRRKLGDVAARIETARPVPAARALEAELEIDPLAREAEGGDVAARSARARLETAFVRLAFYLPRRLWRAEEWRRAAVSLELAAAIKPDRIRVLYDLACARALSGKKTRAAEALERAVAAGFSDLEHLESDPDLATIRGEAGYRRAVETLRRRAGSAE
jgi:predicted esterase